MLKLCLRVSGQPQAGSVTVGLCLSPLLPPPEAGAGPRRFSQESADPTVTVPGPATVGLICVRIVTFAWPLARLGGLKMLKLGSP